MQTGTIVKERGSCGFSQPISQRLTIITGLDRKRLEFARYLVRTGKIKG